MTDNNHTTLILPLVSAGNVPQLTIDLLLHSLSTDFKFVKDLESTYCHPFVGPLDYSIENNEDGSVMPALYNEDLSVKKFSTALELFSNSNKDIFIIQQRTPIIQGYLNNFIQEVIIPLIVDLGISNLIILDSFSTFDNNILKNQNNHANSNNFSMGTCQIESINDMIDDFQSNLNIQIDPETSLHFTNSLFKFNNNSLLTNISTNQQIFKFTFQILNNQSIKKLTEIKYLNLFINEGDNSIDAERFCQFLINSNGSLNLPVINHFKRPISWKGVYGLTNIPSTIDDGLYI